MCTVGCVLLVVCCRLYCCVLSVVLLCVVGCVVVCCQLCCVFYNITKLTCPLAVSGDGVPHELPTVSVSV